MRLNLHWRRVVTLGLALCLLALPAACAPRRAPAARAKPTPNQSPVPTRWSGPATVGREAPDFSFPTMEGQTARLSDYRGQVVLVNVWATWCGPCRMEVPDLVAAYQQYKDRGFTVLAVNQGEPREQVLAFAGHFGMSFPVLLDEEGHIRSHYPYRGIPTTFVVDREGVVRNIWVGTVPADALSQMVEPLLGS